MSRRLKYAVIWGFWLAFALFQTSSEMYRASLMKSKLTWPTAIISEFGYAGWWAILTPLVLRFARRYPLEARNLAPRLAIHLAGMTVAAVAVKLAFNVTVMPFLAQIANPPYVWTWRRVLLSLAASFDFGVMLYWLIVLAAMAVRYYRSYRDEKVRAARLEAELARAQLRALKMQLHPHFLFNTLHSISALVYDNAEAADRMLVRLGELLRISLDSAGFQEVPLGKEVEFLRKYLEIEKERYEERLDVAFEIPDDLLGIPVPSFILQPLVENAIRHGIDPAREPGSIAISAERIGHDLRISVSDTGVGSLPEQLRDGQGGVGLANTRARLETLYGPGGRFEIENRESGGVRATILIPIRPTQD